MTDPARRYSQRELDHTKEKVTMDVQVALRIINHARQVPPTMFAQGQLLGLDIDDELQVTACFGYKKSDEEMTEESHEEQKQYRAEVLSAFQQVNFDANPVGWYSSTGTATNFFPENLLDMQLGVQRSLGMQSVAVICNPNLANSGRPSLRAYRLKIPHSILNRNQDAASMGINSRDLVEIPITLRCSPLVECFLMNHVAPRVTNCYDALHCDLGQNTENGMRQMIEGLQRLQSEQSQIYQYERQIKQMQRGKGMPPLRQGPVPNDTMLTTRQIKDHCDHVGANGEDVFPKLFLAQVKMQN